MQVESRQCQKKSDRRRLVSAKNEGNFLLNSGCFFVGKVRLRFGKSGKIVVDDNKKKERKTNERVDFFHRFPCWMCVLKGERKKAIGKEISNSIQSRQIDFSQVLSTLGNRLKGRRSIRIHFWGHTKSPNRKVYTMALRCGLAEWRITLPKM